MTGFRRLLPVLPLGAALALTPVAGAATYELHATARSAYGFTVTLRHATVYDVGVGQVARRVTRGKGWKQTDEIEIHRRRVFSADIQRDPAAPLTARFARLGGPVVTMRPTTGRLTQECVQCI